MSNLLFCQFDTRFLYRDYPDDISVEFYEMIWNTHREDGYYKNESYWEIPLWIAEACTATRRHEHDLYIIKDLNVAEEEIRNRISDYVLFSAMDINREYIKELAKRIPEKKFIVGGYGSLSELEKIPNIQTIESMQGLAEFFSQTYTYGLDFSLFIGQETIPRLRMSKGCWNRCKFCTVGNRVEEVSEYEIFLQAESFKKLSFKLVYIDDKTFGQASNYNILHRVYEQIKSYNPDFLGFIVQTTTALASDRDFVEEMVRMHVLVCEIGVETYNNQILADLWKPQNTSNIDCAVENLYEAGIRIIPNFIIGIPDETFQTYRNTINFIENNKHKFYSLNIYNLALYKETELGKEIEGKQDTDFSELDINKSFHTPTQREATKWFYEKVYKLGIEILSNYTKEVMQDGRIQGYSEVLRESHQDNV